MRKGKLFRFYFKALNLRLFNMRIGRNEALGEIEI